MIKISTPDGYNDDDDDASSGKSNEKVMVMTRPLMIRR